jgi:hypothetical protein
MQTIVDLGIGALMLLANTYTNRLEGFWHYVSLFTIVWIGLFTIVVLKKTVFKTETEKE